MTLPILGSECAPGVFDGRAAFELGRAGSFKATPIDLTGLFGLDRLPRDRRLVCHWARESDGRLASHWEPDIVPIPQR